MRGITYPLTVWIFLAYAVLTNQFRVFIHYSFIHSFNIQSFVRSFVRSFVHSYD